MPLHRSLSRGFLSNEAIMPSYVETAFSRQPCRRPWVARGRGCRSAECGCPASLSRPALTRRLSPSRSGSRHCANPPAGILSSALRSRRFWARESRGFFEPVLQAWPLCARDEVRSPALGRLTLEMGSVSAPVERLFWRRDGVACWLWPFCGSELRGL